MFNKNFIEEKIVNKPLRFKKTRKEKLAEFTF